MKLDQYSKKIQTAIRRLAVERGITPEDVIARFDALFDGRSVSLRRPVFACV